MKLKRSVKYVLTSLELDPLLLNGVRALAEERQMSMAQIMRDAIYTAVYGTFRGAYEFKEAPKPLAEGVSFYGSEQVRVIGGGLYEVDGRCLPLTDEPIELRRRS